MVKNNYTIDIAKKLFQKALVNELYKNEIIEFDVCSNVIKKIDIEIEKIKSKSENTEEYKKIVVKVPL